MEYHIPVLLNECMQGLNLKPDGIYVDLTYGGGGHAKEILKRLDKGRLFAFDCDMDAEKNVGNDKRLVFIRQNYRFFKNFIRYFNCPQVDGIIADLGISSHQVDDEGRGFSFRFDTLLDMRMNKDTQLTASSIINSCEEEVLSAVFWKYGEVENSRRLASLICVERKKGLIDTVQKFYNAVKPCIPVKNENKYMAKVFQALRIEVNRELDSLKAMLMQVPGALKKNGRFVVITYHSLEDRLVKNFLKKGSFGSDNTVEIMLPFAEEKELLMKPVNKKVIVPAEQEVLINNKARSAKLRIAEKL